MSDGGNSVSRMAGSYHRELTIRAPPERVFEAFATTEGVAGWWTTKVSGPFSVGGVFETKFGENDHMRFRIDKVVNPSTVAWTCLERKRGEWQGTRILVTITPDGKGGSQLNFLHEGLTPELDCYEACTASWNLLMPSLKAYAETGRGTPWPMIGHRSGTPGKT